MQLEQNSIEYNRLCRELLKAEQQVLRIKASRWEGDYSDESVIVPSGSAASKPTEEPKALLSQVIAEFTSEGSRW